MGSELGVMTLEDVAAELRVPLDVVEALFEDGALRGFRVGGSWRTTRKLVEQSFEQMAAGRPAGAAAAPPPDGGGEWREIGAFGFYWPNQDNESFDAGFERVLRHNGRAIPLVIGFGDRRAAGRDRRRAVVFWGTHPGSKSPIVEFTGTDDFEQSKLMASVIKSDGRKHLRPTDDVPAAYVGMPMSVYNHVITGPYAYESKCVLLRDDQLDLMARHALLRMEQKSAI